MKISFRRINYFFLVLAIVLGGTVMIRYLNISPIQEIYVRILALVLTVIGIAMEKPRFRGHVAVGAFAIATLLVFYVLIRPYDYLYYLTGYSLFIVVFYIFSYYLIKNKHMVELLDIYENFYIVVCLISLFFWLFGSILHVVPYLADMRYTFADQSLITHNYYFLYFENPVQNVEQIIFGSGIARNCGIYCEAPAFSGRLLYAIAIELFAHTKVNKKKLAVLLITILSTQSAKALVVLIALFGLMYLMENNEGLSLAKLVLKVLGVAVVGTTLGVLAFRVLEAKSAGTSYLARLNIMQASIKTWLSSPMFGAGFNNLDAIIANESFGHGYGGISMGLLVLLACGGLYFVLFYLLAVVVGYIGINKEGRRKYFYVVVMMMINVFISNSLYQYPYLFMTGMMFALFFARTIKHQELDLEQRLRMISQFS